MRLSEHAFSPPNKAMNVAIRDTWANNTCKVLGPVSNSRMPLKENWPSVLLRHSSWRSTWTRLLREEKRWNSAIMKMMMTGMPTNGKLCWGNDAKLSETGRSPWCKPCVIYKDIVVLFTLRHFLVSPSTLSLTFYSYECRVKLLKQVDNSRNTKRH